MIESMRKLNLIIHHQKVNKMMDLLQELGLVHVQVKELSEEEAQSQDLSEKQITLRKHIKEQSELLKELKNFLQFYEAHPDKIKAIKQHQYPCQMSELFDVFQKKIDERENMLAHQEKYKKELHHALVWGEYNPTTLQKLEENGLKLNFYTCSQKNFEQLDLKDHNYQIINTVGGTVCFTIITRTNTTPDIPLELVHLPPKSPSQYKSELKKLDEQLNHNNEELWKLGQYYQCAKEHFHQIQDQHSLNKALSSLDEQYKAFAVMTGWVASKDEKDLRDRLDLENGIFYTLSEEIAPSDAPEVPIMLKNGRFSKLFEPITKLFALPHYMEFDLTPFFAPFFVLFFGLCLADAGYGIIVLALLSVLFFKKPEARPIILMGMILNISVTIWGVLTGTFFGINVFENQLPILSDIAYFKSSHVFYLSLLIGLVQIFFGMFVKMISQMMRFGFTHGLATLGWILLVFFLTVMYLSGQEGGGDFAIGNAVLEFTKSVPPIVSQVGAIIGAALILFFNDMKVNIFMRFGKGLWELYGITGVVGDLLSYIRLFALGISSAILGTVINSIALQILDMGVPVLAQVIFVLFLLVGHVGNLLLAALGSFVHPLRLTFVEFYKNAGFEGGGREFTPFRKYSNNTNNNG